MVCTGFFLEEAVLVVVLCLPTGLVSTRVGSVLFTLKWNGTSNNVGNHLAIPTLLQFGNLWICLEFFLLCYS